MVPRQEFEKQQRQMLNFQREAAPFWAQLSKLEMLQPVSITIYADGRITWETHWSPAAAELKAAIEESVAYLSRHYFASQVQPST